MIPRLLGQTPSNFDANGVRLDGTVSCFVTEELNGDYSLTAEISFDDPNFQNIQIGSVIAVMPNKTDARQGFVVEHIGKPIDGICEIYATHIAQYRGKLIPVKPFTASSLANALTAMKSNSLETNPFTITTDKTSNVAMVQTVPHTFRELMGGTLGSLIDTYSGEYKYNNYAIQFLNRRGRADTDIQVLYGKNMTDFNLEEDFSWTDSVTGVLPFWSMEGSTTVVGSIQYSPYKNLYPYAKTGVLDCTDQFQTPPTAAQLNAYAATYMSNKGIPAVNLEVSFDHLQFNGDKNLQIGDTVTVINSMYNVNYKRRIVGYTFNVLLEEYEGITIGDLKASISDAVNETFNNATSDLKILAENVNYSNAVSQITSRNVQGALDELSARHDITAVTATGTSLMSYTTQGIYWFSSAVTPTDIPAGVNGWLVVIPSNTGWVKQLWLRAGTPSTNDFHTWVRTFNGTTWGAWSRYVTESQLSEAWTNATLNATYISAGTVSYLKIGRLVFVRVMDLTVGAQIPTGITQLATGLPKAESTTAFTITRYNNGVALRVAVTTGGNLNAHYPSAAVAASTYQYYGVLIYRSSE